LVVGQKRQAQIDMADAPDCGDCIKEEGMAVVDHHEALTVVSFLLVSRWREDGNAVVAHPNHSSSQ
jgi:hypothetical protein